MKRPGEENLPCQSLKKWHPSSSSPALVAIATEEHEQDPEELKIEYLLDTSSTQRKLAPKALSHLTPDQAGQIEQLLHEFSDISGAQFGCTTVTEHTVDVGDTPPIRQHPYRVPLAMKDTVRQEINKMLKLGAIKPSSSPWASPVVLVKKKDGCVPFCVDYCKINQVAKFDAYPMPRVEDVPEEVGPAKYISTLDLARGYWQVPMSEESKEKMAFTTPFGLYEFNVMPFGLHTAPATF